MTWHQENLHGQLWSAWAELGMNALDNSNADTSRKTQLAIRYAKTVRERDSSVWILWLFAANASRFDESLHDLAEQIRLPERQDPKANILQLLQIWLANSTRRWIVILDNVDDGGFLLQPPTYDPTTAKRRIDYIPSCGHGTVLLTSRNKNEAHKFVDENNVIEVLPMDILHARSLLQTKLGLLFEEDNAAKLAAALDYMPLALSQAASFIRQKRRYSIQRYLSELETQQSRTSLLRKHGTVPKRDRDASSSIIITWQISFEFIYNKRKSAADLLALMSFCDRQAIPEFLLHDISENQDEDMDTFDDDIQMLENFSFVSTTTDTATWDMHRLVQDAMQWWLQDHDRTQEMKHRYISRLYTIFPPGKYENWKTIEVLLPHTGLAIATSDDKEIALQQSDIFYRMAWFQDSRALYTDAMSNAQKSLWIRAKWLGEEHQKTLYSIDLLAKATENAGLIKIAKELRIKTFTSQNVLGEENLVFMDNLASLYSDQGNHNDAARLLVKILEIRKRTLGEEHQDTLVTMSNLAASYEAQKRLQDAEELEVKVLEIEKRILGEEHPVTLTTMNNLGFAYRKQGRYGDAKDIEVKVLDMRKRILGEMHPDTLTSMHNLSVTLFYHDDLLEALQLIEQCVQSCNTVLGETHPQTVSSIKLLKDMEMAIQEKTAVDLKSMKIADSEGSTPQDQPYAPLWDSRRTIERQL